MSSGASHSNIDVPRAIPELSGGTTSPKIGSLYPAMDVVELIDQRLLMVRLITARRDIPASRRITGDADGLR